MLNKTLISVALVANVALADGPPPDYLESPYQWETDRLIFVENDSQPGENILSRNIRFAKTVMDDPLQTPAHMYLGTRYYAITMSWIRNEAEIRYACARQPPKADDYRYQAICTWFGSSLPEQKVQKIQELAETAQKLQPGKTMGSEIYNDLANQLNQSGRFHEAAAQYKNAFESVPKDAEEDLMMAKINMATIYTNPLLSEKMQRLSIRTFEEIILHYEAKPDSDEKERNMAQASYNMAIAEIFLFKNYPKALTDLQRAMGYGETEQEARVFTGYTLALLGRSTETLAALQQVNFKSMPAGPRRDFFLCYHDLALRLINKTQTVERCLSLVDPQTDVLLNLTEVLQNVGLSPADENRMWKIFYRFFTDHILPDFRQSVEAVSSQAELAKERTDNRLNQLKLQNLGLYKDLSLALAGLTVVLVIAVYLAIRSWKSSRRHANTLAKERQRLQHILDNIDEAIITIHGDLRLEAEVSLHLQAIVGSSLAQKSTLDDLLNLTQLSQDQQNLVRECLRSCFGESRLAWDLNSANLPTEVQINDLCVAMFWEPVFHDGLNISVFLVLRNITEMRKLEQEKDQARHAADRQLNFARQILSGNPKTAASFLGGLTAQVEELKQLANSKPLHESAFRLAHTIKGISRSLGFKDLQDIMHQVEDSFRSAYEPDIRNHMAELESMAQLYVNAMVNILGPLMHKGPSNLFDIMATLRDSLEDQLKQAAIPLAEIRVVEMERMAPHELKKIQEILVHGLSNAADHGFVLPRQRGVTVAPAVFEITFQSRDRKSTLLIRDNGAGIDHASLQKIARDRGWQPQADQTMADILFESGVSTSATITQTSGRGVGLNAIRENVRSLGGTVHLVDNDRGSGTLLKVEWPHG